MTARSATIRRPRWGILLAAVISVAGAPAGMAQSAAPAPLPGAQLVGGRDVVDSSKYLGNIYKKEAEGFKIAPPAGARIIQRTGVDLVSYVVDARSWAGALQLVTRERPLSLDEMLVLTKNELIDGGVFKGVQALDSKRLKHQDKYESARVSFSFEAAFAQGRGTPPGSRGPQSITLFRQELIVQVASNQFMTLTLDTPLKDRAEAEATFNAMVPEFEIFDPAVARARRADAAKNGKTWLAQRSAEELREKLSPQPQLFRIMIGGKDMGYLRFDELTQEKDPKLGRVVDVERDGHKGLLVLVNYRSFPDDDPKTGASGIVNYGQNEAFWCFSKDAKGVRVPDYSSWNNVSKTKARMLLPPDRVPPGGPNFRIVTPWIQEIGVLSQAGVLNGTAQPYQMVVNLSDDGTQPVVVDSVTAPRSDNPTTRAAASVTPHDMPGVNQIIPVEAPSPLPKALEYTWPRFVDLTKPGEMSFIVFDSFSKKLGLRNLIVTGKKETISVEGRAESCFVCIDELDPNSTTLWTDAAGRIRQMRTNDQSVMIPTTEDAMRIKWAGRLADQ